MAWSDAARAAALEARRHHAGARKQLATDIRQYRKDAHFLKLQAQRQGPSAGVMYSHGLLSALSYKIGDARKAITGNRSTAYRQRQYAKADAQYKARHGKK